MGNHNSGRKAKPTNLRLIEGNPGKRGINLNEPKAEPVRMAPPQMLCDDATEEWERISEQLYNMGVLTSADRSALAAYCQCYGRWVKAERAIAKMAEQDTVTRGLMIKTSNGNAIQNPLVGVSNRAMADMVRYAAEFGMTPSARTRIDIEKTRDNDPASKFFA